MTSLSSSDRPAFDPRGGFDFAARFAAGLPYQAFLDQYGTEEHRRRWNQVGQRIRLTDSQRELLGSFRRQMKVLCLAGAWCGDCVNQCPILKAFADASPLIDLRFVDRDADPALSGRLAICGGARVPTVLFLSEDDFPCGTVGDRTLSKYRQLGATLAGAACPVGLGDEQQLLDAVVQDWLNEFERVQWMLRTSARLRQKHGD